MKSLSYIYILIVTFLFDLAIIHANQGCCSWHGGIDYCGKNGYYICMDGSQSPSCTCKVYYLTDEYPYYNYGNNEIIISNLQNKLDKLNMEYEIIQKQKDGYKSLFWIVSIVFVSYFYYKNTKK